MNKVFASLKGERTFEQVRKHGRYWRGQYVKLTIADNNEDIWRVGIVVSRKASNKATARNKVRRRLKAILQEEIRRFAENSRDMIVLVSGSAIQASYSQLKQDVAAALNMVISKNLEKK